MMTDEEKEALLKSVKEPAPFGSGNWKEQELITKDDLTMILQAHLEIKSHPIPEYMIGSLYCIGGLVHACDAIMDHLERRAKLFKGYTKPHQEEKEDK